MNERERDYKKSRDHKKRQALVRYKTVHVFFNLFVDEPVNA